MVHRYVNEGNDWSERAISAGGDAPPEARAIALLSASLGAVEQLDYERTSKRAAESLKLYRELGDGTGVARAAFFRAMSPWFQGDLQRAGPLLEEAEALNQHGEDPWSLLWRRHQHNAVKASSGDYEEARASLERDLASFVEQDNPTRGWTLLALGSLAGDEGDYIKAATHYEESHPLFRELGVRWTPKFEQVAKRESRS